MTETKKKSVQMDMIHGSIWDKLIKYAVEKLNADLLWALEKNTRAIAFYNRHGFIQTGARKFEEGTTEYIVELKREPADGEGET